MKCEKSDFGKFMLSDEKRLIIDEAGLEYDNRKMAMTTDEIYFSVSSPLPAIVSFPKVLDVNKIRKLARHIYLINTCCPSLSESVKKSVAVSVSTI